MPSYNGQQSSITIILGPRNLSNRADDEDIEMGGCNEIHVEDLEFASSSHGLGLHRYSLAVHHLQMAELQTVLRNTIMKEGLEEIQQRWLEEVKNFEIEIQNEEELDILPRVARLRIEARSMEYVEELRRKENQYCVEMNEVQGRIEHLRQRVEMERRRIQRETVDGVLEHEVAVSVVQLATLHLG